jgi:hypothetical protein
MTTFKTTPIIAKEVKAELKSLGVKVLRSAQNKQGVLLTIENTQENQLKAIEFFELNGMGISPTSLMNFRKTDSNYIDYGTVFKWVK